MSPDRTLDPASLDLFRHHADQADFWHLVARDARRLWREATTESERRECRISAIAAARRSAEASCIARTIRDGFETLTNVRTRQGVCGVRGEGIA